MNEPQPQVLQALEPGTVFNGRYQVLRCISVGGMGAVYEALHLETNRRRALKVMLPAIVANEGLRARFKLEATVASGIESEHIVETLDAGIDEATGTPYIVMELLRGQDLAALMAKKLLPTTEAMTLLSQAALALDRTHAAGIVHRDLKPENLFVTYRDDGTPKLKVLDFGIAKVVADSAMAARQTQNMGTPLYMAPEQVTGEKPASASADLYALAHIAYSVLAGEAYWEEEAAAAETVFTLLFRLTKGIVEPPEARARRRNGTALPPGFNAWFARATSAEGAQPFASAADLVTGLADVMGVATSLASRVLEDTERPPPAPLSFAPTLHAVAPTLPDGASAAVSNGPAVPPPRPGAGTHAPVSSDRHARGSSSPRSTTLAIVGGVGAAGLAAVVLALFLRAPAARPADGQAALPPPSAPTVLASAPAEPPPAVIPPAPAVPASSTPPAAPPSSSAAPPRHDPVRPPLPATSPHRPPDPGARCTPPYTLDAQGNKHFKIECLE